MYGSFVILLVLLSTLMTCCNGKISGSKGSSSASGKHTSDSRSANTVSKKDALEMSAVTWNLAEKPPKEDDAKFLQAFRGSDLVVVGVQELEDIRLRRAEGHRTRNIRALQKKHLGKTFYCVAEHKMGGLQLSVYAKKELRKLIEDVQLCEIACGVGNVLTNKGAVMVLLRIQGKTLALVDAHFAAHQTKVKERNADFHRVLTQLVEKAHPHWCTRGKKFIPPAKTTKSRAAANSVATSGGRRTASKTTRTVAAAGASKNGHKIGRPPLKRSDGTELRCSVRTSAVGVDASVSGTRRDKWRCPFDALVFLGDLNYRLDLPRLEIEQFVEDYHLLQTEKDPRSTGRRLTLEHLLSDEATLADASRELALLLGYDQLRREKSKGAVFSGFSEGRISFLPTFKFDVGRNCFDSGGKARCPAWTDRILFACSGSGSGRTNAGDKIASVESTNDSDFAALRLQDYYSVDARSSDHRPVCAAFEWRLQS